MPDILIWHPTSFASDVNKEAGAPLIYKCPEDFRLELVLRFKENDKILKNLEKDPLLHQQMVDAFIKNKDYQLLVKFLGTALKAVNQIANAANDADGDGEADDGSAEFARWFSEASLKKDVEPLLQKLADAGGVVWTNYCKTKGEYTKYKVKIVAQFALISAGMATSVAINVALLATSHFHFGAGSVIGIVGLAKSTVELIGLVVSCMKSVDTAIEEALETFLTVEKDLKSGSVKGEIKQAAKEVADVLFARIVGTGAGLKTLSNAQKKLTLAEKKMLGTELALHTLSKKIQKTIEKIDRLQAQIKEHEKTPLAERIDKGKLGFDLIKIGKLEGKLNQQLKSMQIAQDMFAIRKNLINSMRPQLDELIKVHKNQQRAVEVLSGMLAALEIAGKLATTDFTAIADLVGVSADAAVLVADKAVIPLVGAIAEKVASKDKKKVLQAVV